ncbi:MAG: type II toxin-antitoxin system HicA family toxin [Oscillospiraceae bacterium]|nr:type II toxin-antitoxin system HicA family toxin [Oscillospiraceae bacterium]
MTAREIIKILQSDGWMKKSQIGSHRHFVHPIHPGDLDPKTVKSILKQAGLK